MFQAFGVQNTQTSTATPGNPNANVVRSETLSTSRRESTIKTSDSQALWSPLIWPLVAITALVLFRKHIRRLLDAFSWRLRSGAPITIGSLELPAEEARPGFVTEKEAKNRGIRVDDGARKAERETYYAATRRVMLVHRLLRSLEPGELYDIVVYVIPSYRGTLASVQGVEYYFGGYGWQEKIFPATDRANGFPVVTAAYGPFLCTARLTFTDGGYDDDSPVHRLRNG